MAGRRRQLTEQRSTMATLKGGGSIQLTFVQVRRRGGLHAAFSPWPRWAKARLGHVATPLLGGWSSPVEFIILLSKAPEWNASSGWYRENGFIESFNGRFRDESLNDHWFTSLPQARIQIPNWRRDYNQHRPQSALNYQTPIEFAAEHWANTSAQPAAEECL